MSGIISSSNVVTLNGSNIDVKIKVLDVSQKEAQNFLANRKDSYDSIGAKVGDKDVLVLTQSKQELLSTDQLKINGEIAEIKFVENEVNTTDEYLSKNVSAAGLVGFTLIGAAVGLLITEAVTKGVGLGKGAAIGTVVFAGTILAAINSENNRAKKTNDSITNSITK